MTAKVPEAQNRQSIALHDGGGSVAGKGLRLSGGFSLMGGEIEVAQGIGFLTATVVLTARDAQGSGVSLTLLPDDAERLAAILNGVAGAIGGR
jgi:hypothetical protein